MLIGGVSFNFGNLYMGAIRKSNTDDAVLRVNCDQLGRRYGISDLPIVEGQLEANTAIWVGGNNGHGEDATCQQIPDLHDHC